MRKQIVILLALKRIGIDYSDGRGEGKEEKRMPKFVTKRIVVEAEQWFPGVKISDVEQTGEQTAVIQTLEGHHLVSPGDWIITRVKGEKYPVKDSIFEATYEDFYPDE